MQRIPPAHLPPPIRPHLHFWTSFLFRRTLCEFEATVHKAEGLQCQLVVFAFVVDGFAFALAAEVRVSREGQGGTGSFQRLEEM